MIRSFFERYLFHLIAAGALCLVLLLAYQWITGFGYRAQTAAARLELAKVRGQLIQCKGTAASRLSQLEAQNAATEDARRLGEQRRRSALDSRNEALRALKDTQAKFARLQQEWPQDCVSAVDRVRQEYGL